MTVRLALLCCAVLGAALAVEVAWQVGAGPPQATLGPATAAPTARQALAAPVQEWVADSLARPLFTPGRRPVEATLEISGAAGLPRLAGIIVGPGGSSAIFAGSGVAKPIIAEAGTRLGPYRVQSIAAGEVTVTGPEGVRVLHPSFLDAAASPPPSAPARPAPALPAAARPAFRPK